MLFVFLFVFLIKLQSTHAGLRIYGGRDATENEFPYAVAMKIQVKKEDEIGEIQTKYMPLCSGALISPTWCLTAAHCISSGFNEKLKILPASIKCVLTNQDLSKISEITWGIMHPTYKGLSVYSYPFNDIGLLRSELMVLTQYAKLSALQYTTLTGLEATSVGYGMNQTRGKDTSPFINVTLKVLKTVIMRCPKQQTRYMRGLCISHECANVGAICGGDSGSPLVHASGVIGVISLGYPNCDVTKTYNYIFERFGFASGVAVPISPSIDWITKIVTDHNNT